MHPRLAALNWPMQTDRLSIRPIEVRDAAACWEIRRLDAVARWITSAAPDLAAYRELYRTGDVLDKHLVIEHDGRIIGDLYCSIEDAWAQTEVEDRARGVQAEIGWTLHPDRQGSGYATEAVTRLLRICFQDLGLRRVVAQCFADNEPSWRLMERLGMRREAHNVADSLHRSGAWLDGFGYAMLAREWRERRTR